MPPKDLKPEKVAEFTRPEEKVFRALIVDRDPMSSGLLADMLIRDLSCEAVATRGTELLRSLAAKSAHIVAIGADLNGKAGAGFELARAVSAAHPEVPIVMLLDQPNREAVITAFRSGARGVFNRAEPVVRFLQCIEHVRKGCIWAGGEETRYLLQALKGMPVPGAFIGDNLSHLTTRELQVVRCAANGKTNKTIASELGLSEHTVKNYLFKAFDKLGVSSRVELLFFLTVGGPPPAAAASPLEHVDAAD